LFNIGNAGTVASGFTKKQFVFGFEGVTFKTVSQPIMHAWNHTDTTGHKIQVNLDECTFDFAGTASGTNISMFSFASADAVWEAEINMNNCALASQNTTYHKIYDLGTNDTANAGYGVIGSGYADKEAYPIALFTNTGSFIGAYAEITDAYRALYSKDPTASYVILVRRDVNKIDSACFNGAFKGDLLIDLGGNTVTMTQLNTAKKPSYFLDFSAGNNADENFEVNVQIKNGKLVKNYGTAALVGLNYSSGLSKDARYNLDFDNVTFVSKTGTNVVFVTWEDGFSAATANVLVDADFNNCTFDLAGSAANSVMLNLTHSSGERNRLIYNVKVNGGNVIASSTEQFNNFFVKRDTSTEGRVDTITYSSSGASYPTVTLPIGCAAPAGEYNGLRFILDSATATTVTYALAPIPPVSFVPKTSVTLFGNFTYNVYLPKTDALTAAKLNSEDVVLEGLSVVVIDTVEYYKLTVTLNSYEALEDIVVNVTVSGHKGTFTFGLCEYAATVMSGSYTETEKTLVKDMLSYAIAAYDYWEVSSDNLAYASALLGDNYNATSIPDMTKEVKDPTGSAFKSVTFHLGDSPAYRFYYDGAAPSYTYTVGERRVNAKVGSDTDGTYVEIKVYAYEIPLGISFTDGESTYEYNVYSYYANADATVKPLVERLVKYCESAEAYRVSVVDN